MIEIIEATAGIGITEGTVIEIIEVTAGIGITEGTVIEIIEVTAGIGMIVGEIVVIETTTTAGATGATEIATEMMIPDVTAIGIPIGGGSCEIIVETFGLAALP